MTRGEKRLAVRSGVLGVLITLLVMAVDYTGLFEPFENWLFDQRVRTCQFFLRPPTDLLVHVDLDDQTILSIGWPVQREVIAEIVDEIGRAKAKVLAFDVVFSDPHAPSYEIERPDEEGGSASTQPSTRPAVVKREIDHDAALAASFRRFGRVLVPASFDLVQHEESPLHNAVREVLVADLELTAAEVAQRLRARQGGDSKADLDQQVVGVFGPALRAAAYERIGNVMRARGFDKDVSDALTAVTLDDLRVELLPRTPAAVRRSALIGVVQTELDRWKAQQAMRRFARAEAASGDAPLLPARDVLAPIAPLGLAAGGTGYVDYLPQRDGVIRTMPLWVTYKNGVYPQEGLALACAMLDIDPADPKRVTITEDAVTLSPDGREPIVIPVRTFYASNLGRNAGACMEIPWFGGRDWTKMYARAKRDPHVSADIVWQTCLTRRSVRANNAAADDAIKFFLERLDPDKRLPAYVANPPPVDDFPSRAKAIDALLAELKDAGWLDGYEGKGPQDFTDPVDRTFVSSLVALRGVRGGNAELSDRLDRQEAQLRSLFEGRAALFGWVATAAAGSDFVPTPLHPRCPGVVIHGAIFNGIMTGELWKSAPMWATQLLTLTLGLVTTAAVTFLSPWKAVAATLVTLAAYLAFNGVVVFDYLNVTAEFAGSGAVVAAGLVYSGCTLMRLLVEGIERARITRRFRAYNDPALVDYIIENPDAAGFKGEVRELTVVFTDLTDFTALSEKLGEATVPVLNRYLDCMVPVIRRHHGYVNKFLGDGIMFFFGAPRPNDDHAADAVATVLEMRKALADFNRQLEAEGLAPLEMRAGVSTGRVIVGDAGSAD